MPRYEVHSITGYPALASRSNGSKLNTSYWVADTHDCYREVPMRHVISSRPTVLTTHIRRMADRNCARLNAEEDANAAA